MTIGEATRQYQAALEARRALKAQYEGILSFERDFEMADADVDLAHAQLLDAYNGE